MTLPPKNKRVLAWVDGEQYPFVGYFDEVEGWRMEVEYLNCDTHRNDIFGEVVAWQELPSRPTPRAADTPAAPQPWKPCQKCGSMGYCTHSDPAYR